MNRSILSQRLSCKQDFAKPNRKLSRRFADNLKEWLRAFMALPTYEEHHDELREVLILLHRVRNDMAHNVWSLRFDQEQGLAVDVVQENPRFIEEDETWSNKRRDGDRRGRKAPPETSWTKTYFHNELVDAIVAMKVARVLMRHLEASTNLKEAERSLCRKTVPREITR